MANISEVLGRNIDSVKELKKAIGELQNSLIGLDSESQEFKDTSMKLAAAQDELTKVTKAGKEENVAAKDSVVGMEQEYKKLYNTYKMLTEEQRNSDFGKEMAASLETLSTKLNDTKQGVGNFKDNIGRYAGSVTDAFSKMGVSAGALQGPLNMAKKSGEGLGKVFKDLAKNPWMLVLSALVAILGKAAEAIKNNEELTNRLKEAMAVFKPVLDAVSNAFDFLAGIIVKTVEGLTKVAAKIMSVIPGMKDAVKSHQDLAKATNDLTKAQRENSVVASEKQAEIERLREEASATDDVVEKKKLLEEAKAMQAEVDQKEIELAQEELRILQEYGEKTANSAEENDKLAAAQKKVNDAIAQGERNMRMYNKQLDATEKGTKSATSSGKNYREEAKKLYEQLIEDSKDEVTKITEKYEKEKKLLEKYHFDTKLLTKKYNKEIADIKAAAALEGLRQQKADLDKEWALWRRKGKEDIALALEAETLEKKAIPAVTKLNDDVSNLLKSFRDLSKMPDLDAAFEGMANAEEMINKGGFSAFQDQIDLMKEAAYKVSPALGFAISHLADEYQNIQNRVDEANASYGLSITTVSNLGTSLEELKTRLKEVDEEYKTLVQTKAGDEAFERIEKRMNVYKEGLYNSLFNFFSNNDFHEVFDFAQNFAAESEYAQLEIQKGILEEELANFQGTQEQKLEMLQQYYEVVNELRERDRAAEELNMQRHLEVWDAAFERNNAMKNAVTSIADAYKTWMQAEIDSGKLSDSETKRKKKNLETLEKIQLAVTIATIAANTAGGIIDVWRGYAAELPVNAQTAAATGPAAAATKAGLDAQSLASAILRTGVLSAEGTAQIAAAVGGYISKSKTSSMDSGSGDSVGVTPALIDSTPYSYARVVQTEEDVQEINKNPIWVSVVDVENALGQRAQVVGESSF